MEYIGAKTKPLDHNVTIEEVQEYFVDYILNDRLGIIDDAHIVFADSEPRRAMSSKCIKLAKLHSKASAWYHVTYHYSYWGYCNEGVNRAHFLSFPWCVFDKLIQIKKDQMSNIIA
uniref:RDRP C-terminal head domain-containing protein n=1 Tax=Quercus lobata TaxID=97700 RepID=A0A7N2L8V1_QUELO